MLEKVILVDPGPENDQKIFAARGVGLPQAILPLEM
jgi:hypothetical protein